MKKRKYFIVDGRRIPTTKNVKYAAKKLPVEVQEEFLRIWEAAGCLDIYSGYLLQYFQVIRQQMEGYKEKIEKMEKARNIAVDSLMEVVKEIKENKK